MLKALKKYNQESNSLKTSQDSEETSDKTKAQNRLSRSSKKAKKKLKKNKQELALPIEIMNLKKLKPNFFLGFQVNNVDIHKKVKRLQEEVIKRNTLLQPALVNISTLHITLAVTHLQNEKDIKILKDKLNVWAGRDKPLLFNEPVVLNFTGINSFNNVVAYVDIERDHNYQKLCNISKNLNDLLASAGLMTEHRPFSPHLTILKLSRDYKLLRSKKKFVNDFEFMKECVDHFGKQEICQIQLLSMDDEKDESGYYKCFHQIDTTNSELQISCTDHTECCTPISMPDTSKI